MDYQINFGNKTIFFFAKLKQKEQFYCPEIDFKKSAIIYSGNSTATTLRSR